MVGGVLFIILYIVASNNLAQKALLKEKMLDWKDLKQTNAEKWELLGQLVRHFKRPRQKPNAVVNYQAEDKNR